MKRIKTHQIHNFRDLGDIPIENYMDIYTQPGKIFRAGIPVVSDDYDLQILKELGIDTIIDLRSVHESSEKPFAYLNESLFHYYNFPIRDIGITKKDNSISLAYWEMVQNGNMIKKIMECIGKSQKGVLVGCGLGKDRTGVICALLLTLIGVNRNDILADYQVSYTYLLDFIHSEMINNPQILIRESKIEYLEIILNRIDDEYGNIYNYFNNIGVNKFTVNTIIERLIKIEKWDIYDIDEKIIERQRPKNFHLKPDEFHRVINVWIKTDYGYIITKRKKCKFQGGKWECIGGSVISGEELLEACQREIEEELKIQVNDFKLIDRSIECSKIIYTFTAKYFGGIEKITLSDLESSSILFIENKRIESMMYSELFMSTIYERWKKYKKSL